MDRGRLRAGRRRPGGDGNDRTARGPVGTRGRAGRAASRAPSRARRQHRGSQYRARPSLGVVRTGGGSAAQPGRNHRSIGALASGTAPTRPWRWPMRGSPSRPLAPNWWTDSGHYRTAWVRWRRAAAPCRWTATRRWPRRCARRTTTRRRGHDARRCAGFLHATRGGARTLGRTGASRPPRDRSRRGRVAAAGCGRVRRRARAAAVPGPRAEPGGAPRDRRHLGCLRDHDAGPRPGSGVGSEAHPDPPRLPRGPCAASQR